MKDRIMDNSDNTNEPQKEPPVGIKKQSLLILCDDQAEFLLIIEKLKEHHHLVTTTNLEVALEELKTDPDVILVASSYDTTFKLLKAFKERRRLIKVKTGSFTPANFLCTYSNETELLSLLKGGARDCLQKKIAKNTEIMLLMLNKLLESISKRRQYVASRSQ